MGQIDNLAQGNLGDIFRRLRALEYATNQNNMAVGRGGITVYDGGEIKFENGSFDVSSGTFTGTLRADGQIIFTGTLSQSGGSTFNGATVINGDTQLNGATDVTGALTLSVPLGFVGGGSVAGDAGDVVVTAGATAFTVAPGGIYATLPTTTNPANLYADPVTGKLYRTTA